MPDGVDAVADGSVQHAEPFDAVRDGGEFATVRGFRADAPRRITIHPVRAREYARAHDQLDRPREQAEAGAITRRVAATSPAAEAAAAQRRLAKGGTRGRLVLEF
ncbi:MAG: zinc-binding dehydrogenase [Ilumatobacteraceae bacterium]